MIVVSKTNRNPWFDNIKGLLILLVVFGHTIEIYRDIEGHSLTLYLYNFIYFFHMPLFIMVSGYFFRANKYDRTIQLMIVYIIWQILNAILEPLINKNEWVAFNPDSRVFEIFIPHWSMWYLLAIICWSIVTPYFLRFKYPLIAAMILAVWAGYTEDLTGWFSFRKLLTFYPYYLIGYYLANNNTLIVLSKKTDSWKNPLKYLAFGIVLAGAYGMYLFTKNGWETAILFMRDPYIFFEWSLYKGVSIHLLMYAAIIIFSISLMLIIPKNKPLFLLNKFGMSSLFIYLVHTNIIRIYRQNLSEETIQNEPKFLLFAAILALFICTLLSTPFIQSILKSFIEPNIEGLLKPKDKPHDVLQTKAEKAS